MLTMILLGKRLLPDGTLPPALRDRLYIAVDAYARFQPDRILLSGGKTQPSVPFTEAEAMKKALIEQGIPEDLMIKEEGSHSTFENMRNVTCLLKELHADEVLLITSLDHMSRALMNPVAMLKQRLKKEQIRLTIYSTDRSGIDLKMSKYL